MTAALYGGLRPGVAAMASGELLGDFFFVQPLYTLGPRSAAEWTYCLTFLASTLTILLLVEALKRARERAERSLTLAQARGQELVQTQRNIEEADARARELAGVLQSAPDSVVTLNLLGEVTSWNPGSERLFGYSASEMLGQTLVRTVPSGSQGELAQLNEKLQRGERLEAFETVRLTKDGRQVDVSMNLSPVRDAKGNVRGASAILRDVTPLKRATLALRQSERKLEVLAEAVPLMLCELDAQQRCTWANQAWLSFMGGHLEQHAGHGWEQAIHIEDRQRYLAKQREASSAHEPFELEFRLRRHDGEHRWFFQRAVPHFSNHGALLGYVVSWLDVTARKLAEEALREKIEELRKVQQFLREHNEQLLASREALDVERSRYNELFNSAPVACVVTNLQGVIQQVNAAAASLLRQDSESLERMPLARLLPKEARPGLYALMNRLAQQQDGTVEDWETTFEPPRQSAFPCSLLARRLEDRLGKPVGFRWMLSDVTARKQVEDHVLELETELEERVRERTIALEAANRELEAFNYSVSHDLRAPVRCITGFSNALLEEYSQKLEPPALKYLKYTYEAGMRMSRLIDDLIDLSRATRGELCRQQVDLSALATLVVAEFVKREPCRDLEVSIQSGLIAEGDEGLLRIALENLLDNAWKFTRRQSKARIEVGVIHKEGSRLFYVRDNGAGFSMLHAGRLFGVFQRLHSQEEFPGTGIGLATVRRIFARHGGEVWAEGKVNEGATFYFTVPASIAYGPQEQQQAA